MAAESISKSRFKSHALALMRKVEQEGSELVITDRGKPVLRLVPYEQEAGRLLEQFRGSGLHYPDPFEPAAATSEWDGLG